VKRRLIYFCIVWLLAEAAALAAGNYQRTKDGKVTVWNGDPKPGDAARWFGGRDKDGYASGAGTLIWYNAAGAFYARYHGKMVRGKFDGAIDVRSQGKVAHAIFADGKRTTRWAAGPTSQSQVASTAENGPTVNHPDQQAPKNPEMIREQAAPAAKAETRGLTSARTDDQTVAKMKPEEQPQNSSQPSGVISAEAEAPNADQPHQNIPAQEPERETPKIVQQTPSPPSQRSGVADAEPGRQTAEELKENIPSEGPAMEKQMDKPAAEVSEQKPSPEATRPTPTIQDKPEVADLSGPPSELRTNSAGALAPPDIGPEVASSPSGAQLIPHEAIALADDEARAHGYDLAGYERAKGDYSAVKKQWSFFYNAKNAGGAVDKPPAFLVTVDDATKKAAVIANERD
jgi:hypothetical protein